MNHLQVPNTVTSSPIIVPDLSINSQHNVATSSLRVVTFLSINSQQINFLLPILLTDSPHSVDSHIDQPLLPPNNPLNIHPMIET